MMEYTSESKNNFFSNVLLPLREHAEGDVKLFISTQLNFLNGLQGLLELGTPYLCEATDVGPKTNTVMTINFHSDKDDYASQTFFYDRVFLTEKLELERADLNFNGCSDILPRRQCALDLIGPTRTKPLMELVSSRTDYDLSNVQILKVTRYSESGKIHFKIDINPDDLNFMGSIVVSVPELPKSSAGLVALFTDGVRKVSETNSMIKT